MTFFGKPRTQPIEPAAPAPAAIRSAARRLNGLTWLWAALVLLAPVAAAASLWLRQTGGPIAAPEAMEAAQSLYNRGDVAMAAQGWQQLADQGVGGKALYYNLGIARLQLGEAARAVETLRAAQALWPRDVQIRTALEQAQQALRAQGASGGAGEATPKGLPAPTVAERFRQRYLSATELALAALVAWAFVSWMAVLALRARTRALRGRAGAAAFVGAVATVLFLVLLLA